MQKKQESDSIAQRCRVDIISNSEIARSIFYMIVEYPKMLLLPRPGQFVNLYCNHQGRLLPRPISVCEVECTSGFPPKIHLIYAVVGGGTTEFSQLQKGSTIELLAPLGNGFHIPEKRGKALLVCGGVGTPPMVELAKTLHSNGWNVDIVAGFREEPFLYERLAQFGKVYIATDNGSNGFHGNVVQLLEQEKKSTDMADMIFACGPSPMLYGIQQFAKQHNFPTQLSLEERMGCGFGGCVGCVVKIADATCESGFRYKKVCKDGPVFFAEEVVFQ